MVTIADGVEHMNINNLADKYYLSNDFNTLADKTKVDYKYCFSILLSTEVDGKSMAGISLTKMTGAIARRAYEEWLGRGIYLANAVTAVSRKMYSFGMEMGYAETIPSLLSKGKLLMQGILYGQKSSWFSS